MALDSGKKFEGVTIKGSASGLLVRLDENEEYRFESLLESLAGRLHQSEKFFQRALTFVDLGRREVTFEDLERLQGLLARYEMKLEHIVSGSNATRSAAKQANIEFKLPSRQNTRPPVSIERDSAGMPFDSAEALFVRRTLRSGQVIKHHADICLLGDVNPGAEIVAGGSVIVWGIVRGVIQAGGLDGPDAANACVCALQLNPSILRIGSLVARAPEGTLAYNGPEMALVRNGAIMLEPWMPGKKR